MREYLLKHFEPEDFDEQQIDEPERAQWTITDDGRADWAVQKIREAEYEYTRLKQTIDDERKALDRLMADAERRLSSRTSFFYGKLEQYFQTVPHAETKTQESYRLPHGVLKQKRQNPQFARDDTKLVEWLRPTHPELIKTKESANWQDLKPLITIHENQIIFTATGEQVDGVTVEHQPPVFVVE